MHVERTGAVQVLASVSSCERVFEEFSGQTLTPRENVFQITVPHAHRGKEPINAARISGGIYLIVARQA